MRLQREAEVHDLDLVAARRREIQHLAAREQVHDAAVLEHELLDVVLELAARRRKPLEAVDVDLGREVADVRENGSVAEVLHDGRA